MIDNLSGNAINKIENGKMILTKEQPEFEVKIKKDGKVIYHNKAHAGILNMVQSFKTDGREMEGDSQVFTFGSPLQIVFAFDQLWKKLAKVVKIEIKK